MTYKEWKKLNPDIIQKRKEEKRMVKEKENDGGDSAL